MRLRSLIPKHAGIRGTVPLMGEAPHQLFLADWINSRTNFFFSSGKIYIKDVEYTEINEKSILRFLVFEIWTFFPLKISNFQLFSP